ncbi:hypothetical protein [Leptospira alstonii]|uniref:DNA-binding helix-turn-helix protein n=1 Tax=Leptospira alstonii serovar Sichuan str. 79601 TaxID=1218565 RepID=M6CYE8_9LEPT|nr:hypothetical protein [Leptospira alstonii]AGS80501.1 hypothetical protein LEP1GSC193_0706 [Leptospira phage vB_LalZ_80412-LE1]EMJ95516.1 hypothetical protein LEP1GSC194_3507 [Leptospira alstonii serovar Sichuan str. 79601]
MGEAISTYALTIPNVIESLPLPRAKRQLLAKITELDIAGKKKGLGGCIAKNKTLGNAVKLAETTVSKYIREMKREGYLKAGTFHGHHRILHSTLHNAVTMERNQYNQSKLIEKNPSQPSVNSLANGNQEYGAVPYESTEPILSNKGTNKTNNKKKNKTTSSSPSEVNWSNISEHTEILILKEWGEYDHTPKLENAKIKLWTDFQKGEKPEIILETIQKLIYIRRSEKYKTHTFWNTIPVNISSSYSYKDQIKNTYNALVKYDSGKTTEKSVKQESVSQRLNLMNRKYQAPTWEGFLNWSSERLTKSSIEILKQVQIKFEDNETLLILNEVPESLRMIITKYFTEEVQKIVPVEFKKAATEEKSDLYSKKKTDINSNKGKLSDDAFPHEEFIQKLTALGRGGRWSISLV